MDGRFRIYYCFPPAGVAPNRAPNKNYQLPHPYGGKNDPVAYLDCAIETQGQEGNENQETGVNDKFPVKKNRFSKKTFEKSIRCLPWVKIL